MAVRLIVPIQAAPGKRDELIEAYRIRCQEVRSEEKGCEEYELYQSIERPDHLALLERWTDEAALSAHAELNKKRSNNLASLRTGHTYVERYIDES